MSLSPNIKQPSILWADDDVDDLELFRSAIEEVTAGARVVAVHNGREALDYLEEVKDLPARPCLIVLDMNMPILNGRETLVLLKNNEDFRNIPTIVFTTSNSSLDRMFCQRYGVEMLTKPIEYNSLREVTGKFLAMCGG